MKLAEALQIRADLQKRLEQIEDRLEKNATYQEGEKPFENPSDLLRELDGILAQYEPLIININYTNYLTKTAEGDTLTALIARRDVLKIKIKKYQALLESATERGQRYGRNEVKMYSSINVPEYRKIVDQLSKQFRELDTKIQGINWNVDLIEQ